MVDENGNLPNWANWLMGGVIIAGTIVASVYTAGAAGAFAGTCNYTQLGMAISEYNKAYTNCIVASATDKIIYSSISGAAAGLKSAFTILLKKYLEKVILWTKYLIHRWGLLRFL